MVFVMLLMMGMAMAVREVEPLEDAIAHSAHKHQHQAHDLVYKLALCTHHTHTHTHNTHLLPGGLKVLEDSLREGHLRHSVVMWRVSTPTRRETLTRKRTRRRTF